MRTLRIAGAAALLVVVAAGCSTAKTDYSQVGLHYSGGSLSAQTFKDCVPASTRRLDGPGDVHYYYPTGQRTFKFSDDEGSDADPLRASTKDTQELVVRGTVTFTLNTECPVVRLFHETIGRKYAAWSDSESEPGAGWDRMLSVYIKDVLDRAVDNEALKYDWRDLYNNVETKGQWEKSVLAAFPALVQALAGGPFFEINSVLLQKPEIEQGLKDQLRAKQEATLRKEASDVDKSTAEQWPGGIAAYLAYQRQLAVNKAIAEGKVQIIPVPEGGGVNVNVTPK